MSNLVVTKPNKAKILMFDIETSPILGWVWGLWEQNVIRVHKPWYMLSYAYKWLGDKTTKVQALPDFPLFEEDMENDYELTKSLWNLLDECDATIAHNGRQFDVKKANARFAVHGMPPPSPYAIIDTRAVAKRYFRFDSNALDDLGEYFGLGKKVKHEGIDMWLDAMKGDKRAWRNMKKYNKGDVDLMEKVYLHMRPWMVDHPNFNLLNGTTQCCPNCGGSNLQRRGYRLTRVSRYQRYQCQDCGAWPHAPENRIVR